MNSTFHKDNIFEAVKYKEETDEKSKSSKGDAPDDENKKSHVHFSGLPEGLEGGISASSCVSVKSDVTGVSDAMTQATTYTHVLGFRVKKNTKAIVTVLWFAATVLFGLWCFAFASDIEEWVKIVLPWLFLILLLFLASSVLFLWYYGRIYQRRHRCIPDYLSLRSFRLLLYLFPLLPLALIAVDFYVAANILMTLKASSENSSAVMSTQSSLPPSSGAGEVTPIKCNLKKITGDTASEAPLHRSSFCKDIIPIHPYEKTRAKLFSLVGDGSCVEFSSCDPSTEFDTRIRVYITQENDASSAKKDCIAANEDDNLCQYNPLHSTVKFTSSPGTSYFILIDGFGNDAYGSFSLSINCTTCSPSSDQISSPISSLTPSPSLKSTSNQLLPESTPITSSPVIKSTLKPSTLIPPTLLPSIKYTSNQLLPVSTSKPSPVIKPIISFTPSSITSNPNQLVLIPSPNPVVTKSSTLGPTRSKIDFIVDGFFSMGDPSYVGSGCPDGSVQTSLESDGGFLSLFFPDFIAITDGEDTFDRKSCNLVINVDVQFGYSLGIFKVQYRGYTHFDGNNDGYSKLTSEYFFSGKEGYKYSQTYYSDQEINYQSNLGVIAYSGCGAKTALRINTSLLARKEEADSSDILIGIDSADLSEEPGLRYYLITERC